MFTDQATQELAYAVDDVAGDLLAQAGISGPPVDCLALADELGMAVATDGRQQSRARFVRLSSGPGRGLDSILLRPEPRWERRQWAIAHEIGEWVSHRVFDKLALDPREAPVALREHVANLVASRLLLPTNWLAVDAERTGWDLFALKQRYRTASHELLARRMLDFSPPVVITLFDQEKLTWRRSNVPGRPPALTGDETRCLEKVRTSGTPQQLQVKFSRVSGWPIHEENWRREILRTEAHEWAES